jgi:hypothetical protein
MTTTIVHTYNALAVYFFAACLKIKRHESSLLSSRDWQLAYFSTLSGLGDSSWNIGFTVMFLASTEFVHSDSKVPCMDSQG